MSSIKDITLDDGTVVFVEVEEVQVSIPKEAKDLGLPPGAEATGAGKKVLDSMKSLQGTLRGVFQVVHEAVREKSPSEWGVELSIGFKGKSNPIPVILSGEANAALKVHAKWKKAD